MRYKQLLAAASAAIFLLSCASCGDGTKLTVDESSSGSSSVVSSGDTEPTVGDVIQPKEDSAEYDLGSYRMSSTGVKLYYDEDIPVELMFALDKYFTCFQNNDFETYKTLVYPDYAERYEAFLQKDYQYGLDKSFELNCENLRDIMKMHVDEDSEQADDITGDFSITRIKAEAPELTEGETMDDLNAKLFSYFNEIFGLDYYEFVKENSDDIRYVSFYIYAKGEDGEEHRLISGYDIAFAVKDGTYYTFG